MKAMIFAAGLGTRLRPLTDRIPKALVPVAGKPGLQRALENIRDAGITDVVVNVHHFAGLVIDFLKANDNFGLNISVSDESEMLLDTGGGLYKALPMLGNEPVLLHNADVVTDLPLGPMIDTFSRRHCGALLLVSNRKTSRKLLFNRDGRMCGWRNEATGEVRPRLAEDEVAELEALAFGGIHILSPELYSCLAEYSGDVGPKFSITPFYIAHCPHSEILAYQPNAPYRWHDIGRPESLALAEEAFGR